MIITNRHLLGLTVSGLLITGVCYHLINKHVEHKVSDSTIKKNALMLIKILLSACVGITVPVLYAKQHNLVLPKDTTLLQLFKNIFTEFKS